MNGNPLKTDSRNRRQGTGAQPSGCRSVRCKGNSRIIFRPRRALYFCSLKAALLAGLVTALCTPLVHAQLQVVTNTEPQRAFAGAGREVSVRLHNAGASPVAADLRTRLYQASSATAAPLGEAPWKKLVVLAGQTVLESTALTFPPVEAETSLLVQWLDGKNKVIGVTEVLVYPPDLLKDLRPLADEAPIGAFDPQNQVKPLLKAAAVDYQDLEDRGLDAFDGKLAIIGPFQSWAQMREGLPNRVKAQARKGAAVVWIQPPPEKRHELKPSFYAVPEGKGAVVVVQADLVVNLADSPQAQLNLMHFAQLALHPEPLQLPNPTPSP